MTQECAKKSKQTVDLNPMKYVSDELHKELKVIKYTGEASESLACSEATTCWPKTIGTIKIMKVVYSPDGSLIVERVNLR